MQKQTLLIVINDFQKGGAEILLVGILPELNERYNVILVTLRDKSDFKPEEIVCSKHYNLEITGIVSVLKGIRKLKKIIRTHNPALVHAHLIYGSLIARIACPSNIPLLYTLHDALSNHFSRLNRIFIILEKNTIKSNHSVIAVSNEVMTDYELTIKKVKNKFILYNYIGDIFIQGKQPSKDYNHLKELRLVAVGNIRAQKNYGYLIKALTLLKQYPHKVTLDVYGKEVENLLGPLQKEVVANQLPVLFKGKADNVHEILPNYDLCVLSSKHEGFGIAITEAMASGLPLMLSDLPVLRSVTFNNAIFFDIADPRLFVTRIQEIFDEKYDLNALSAKGIKLAKEHYTKKAYLEKLFCIYDKVTAPSNSHS